MLFKELGDFTIIDTETTGIGKFCRLIEFAAIKFRSGKIVDQYETFVNPHIHIPEDTSQFNGITDEMVINAPLVRDISDEIYSFIGNDVLVAHNAIFDIDVLNRRLSKGICNRYIDTFPIFKKNLQLDSYKLDTIREYFGIEVPQKHRALDDVLLTYKCLLKINRPYEIIIKDSVKVKGNYCISSIKETCKISEILEGLNCVITGDIPGMSRREIQQLVINNGGTVSKDLGKKTKFLVVGESKIGFKKIEAAKEMIEDGYEIEIIKYEDFLDILEMTKKI